MTDPDPSPASERPPSPGVLPQPAPTPRAALETSQPQPIDPEQHHAQPDLEPTHDEGPPSPPPPPLFQPLFTLVTDSTTRQTHHPRVHYVFADDDPDILTDALAHYGLQHQHEHPQSSSKDPSPSGSTSQSNRSNHPPQQRAVVLDLVPKANPDDSVTAPTRSTATGYEVAWASSLSADWAVVSAKISPMSTAETAPGTQTSESDDGAGPHAQRLMLRIEGVDIDGGVPSATTARARKSFTAAATSAARKKPSLESMSGSGSGPAAQGQDYGVIVDEFDRRMGMLRKVVDAGMERRVRMAVADTEGDEASAAVLGADDHQPRRAASTSASASAAHAQGPEQEQEAGPRQQQEEEDLQQGSSGEGI